MCLCVYVFMGVYIRICLINKKKKNANNNLSIKLSPRRASVTSALLLVLSVTSLDQKINEIDFPRRDCSEISIVDR